MRAAPKTTEAERKQEPDSLALAQREKIFERLAEINRQILEDLYSNPCAQQPEPAPRAPVLNAANVSAGGVLALALLFGFTFLTASNNPESEIADAPHLPDATPLTEVPRASAKLPAGQKPVASVSLVASDAAGMPSRRIPLYIDIEASTYPERVVIEINGLPEGARLNKGKRLPDGAWRFDASERRGLYLVLDKGSEDPIKLTLAALDALSGRPAAPTQEIAVRLYQTPDSTGFGR